MLQLDLGRSLEREARRRRTTKSELVREILAVGLGGEGGVAGLAEEARRQSTLVSGRPVLSLVILSLLVVAVAVGGGFGYHTLQELETEVGELRSSVAGLQGELAEAEERAAEARSRAGKAEERRAEAVRRYLVEAGVDEDMIQSKGFGKSSPLVEGTDPESRQRNRRVQIAVVQTTGGLPPDFVVEEPDGEEVEDSSRE